ncbi:MAG: Gfo/Idh/MocA family oxidoreductase [Pseudomonadota bacterium]
MPAPLKVATIGAGYFAQFHHAAWAEEPRAALLAVCDQDLERAQGFAATYGAANSYTDPQAMIDAETPDLVDIITPPSTHKALIEMTAAAGVSTICQKAFCLSLEEAQAAVALAQSAGICLVVHENFRFSPWYRETSKLIADGALGTIYQAAFRLRPGDGQGAEAYLDRQPYFQTMERLLVHETAIHYIDTFRFLLGEPVSVYADLRRLNEHIAGEDAGHILFDFGAGVRALFDGNRLSDHSAEDRRLTLGELTVEGSLGTLRLTGDGGLLLRQFGKNAERPHSYGLGKGFGGGAVAALQSHVLDHLIDGAPLENSAQAYVTNLIIEEAVYRSNREGRKVSIAASP